MVAGIIAAIGCATGVVAAVYAYLPYRANRRDDTRATFVEERRYLSQHRSELTASALSDHEDHQVDTLPGMLAIPAWVPVEPFPLQALTVNLQLDAYDATPGLAKAFEHGLPWSDSSKRFQRYSACLETLAPPTLLDNLPCYGLLAADLSASPPTLDVGLTDFFSGIDQSEFLAHEYAAWYREGASKRDARRKLRARNGIDDPFHTLGRHAIFSVSCLTIRVDGSSATFFLHARDPKAVAIAGSLLHLAPSGVFQPSAEDLATVKRDASPWLTLCREFAEEFLGVEEARGEAGVALSYDRDEPYASLNHAYERGLLRIYVCGLGLDPLTFCPELVTVAVIEAESFDQIFDQMVVRNDEGFLRGQGMRDGRIDGFELNGTTVHDLFSSNRLSPAASSAISTAWMHRESLIGSARDS